MKPSLISKIVIFLCILSLIVGFFCIDKDTIYGVAKDEAKTKKIVSATNKIAVMELEGTIAASYESSLFGTEVSAPALLKLLKSAKTDNTIKGIIIKINSPGGTVAMSQNIYNQIMETRKYKPVIAVFDDVAASGGYYIAAATDRIIAQSGTLTGSIGVIMSFMDYHQLLSDKLNINSVVIKSGKFKDMGSGTRPITEEEKALMQNIINDSYSQFIDAITIGRVNRNDKYSVKKRALSKDVLRAYADGRIFTGRQAEKLGFVDAIGGMDVAQKMIERMAQEKFNNKLAAKLVDYRAKSYFAEYLSAFSEYGAKNTLKLTDFVPHSMILSRRPLYLWE